jgi:hypothetical protein
MSPNQELESVEVEQVLEGKGKDKSEGVNTVSGRSVSENGNPILRHPRIHSRKTSQNQPLKPR